VKSKTTRDLSTPHEQYLADVFPGGHRSKSSGASASDPSDVTTADYVIEAKATESKSISLKLSDWMGIRSKMKNGRRPMMAFRFRDPILNTNIDLVLKDVNDELELLDRLEVAEEKAWRYDQLG
jgi:hypothetical protein